MSITFPTLHKDDGRRGKLTFKVLNDMFAVLRRVLRILPQLEGMVQKQSIKHEAFFHALIRDAQEITENSNRWRYSWIECIWLDEGAGYVPKEFGRSSTVVTGPMTDHFGRPAYNDFETVNDGIGIEGMGVNVDGNPNATIDMQPIPTGLPIYIHAHRPYLGGPVIHTFFATNGYDVQCQEEKA